MIYEFEVRPRLNSYTGVVYTPTRTKDYESLVEQYFLLKYPRFKILEGRIKVNIIAYFSIPKTTKKTQQKKNKKKSYTSYNKTIKSSHNLKNQTKIYTHFN